MDSQLVSIISPVLNCEKFVGEALQSAMGQDYGSVEIIVVDGGSSDGTTEIIADLPGVSLHVKPGLGLYESLNFGLEQAAGEVIGFLNGDDRYAGGAITAAMQVFNRDPVAEVVSGGARVLSGNGAAVNYPAGPQRAITLENMMLGVPLLNARFYRRTLLQRLGGFDSRYPIAADRDLLIRLALDGAGQTGVDQLFYEYRAHPGSMTLGRDPGRDLQFAEQHLALATRYMQAGDWPERVAHEAFTWYQHALVSALAAGLRGRSGRETLRILRTWCRDRRFSAPGFSRALAARVVQRLHRARD